MKLKVEGRQSITDPSLDQVRAAVRSLGEPKRTFLILSRSQMTYIQVAEASSDNFLVEYQERNVGNHFRSVRTDYSSEEIIKILGSFLANDNSWQISNHWIQIKIGGRYSKWEDFSILAGLAGFVFLLVMGWVSMFSEDGKAFGLDRSQVGSIMVFLCVPALLSSLFEFSSLSLKERLRVVLGATTVIVLVYIWVR